MLAFRNDGDIYVAQSQLDDDGLMQVDAASAMNVTNNASERVDLNPSWSPDGTRLAFLRFLGDIDQLVVYDFLLDELTVVLEDEDPRLRLTEPSWPLSRAVGW